MTLKEKLSSRKKPTFVSQNCNVPFIIKFISLVIDLAILILTSFGLLQLMLLTPIKGAMDYQSVTMSKISDSYKLETGVGEITYLTDDNKNQYIGYVTYYDDSGKAYVVTNVEKISEESYNLYRKYIQSDEQYQTCSTNYNLINYGLLCLVSFTSELIFILVVPLCNKRRASIGELCCSELCFNVKRSVRANGLNLTGRFIFIFAVETALPSLVLGELTLIFIPLIRIAAMGISKERRCLSDYVSHTMHIHKDNYYPVVDDID